MTETTEISLKRRPGRPKLPIDRRLQFLSIQVPPEIRQQLDTISIRCDKSISELGREALNLLTFIYAKEQLHGQSRN